MADEDLDEDLARALKRIADKGGGAKFVDACSISDKRRLKKLGLVELRDNIRGYAEEKLTSVGVARLTEALKILAAAKERLR